MIRAYRSRRAYALPKLAIRVHILVLSHVSLVGISES